MDKNSTNINKANNHMYLFSNYWKKNPQKPKKTHTTPAAGTALVQTQKCRDG